jgi:hypothetical protein
MIFHLVIERFFSCIYHDHFHKICRGLADSNLSLYDWWLFEVDWIVIEWQMWYVEEYL